MNGASARFVSHPGGAGMVGAVRGAGLSDHTRRRVGSTNVCKIGVY